MQGISDKKKKVDMLWDEAYSYYKKKDYISAIPLFTQVLELNPNYNSALYYRGICYFEPKKFNDALSDFNKYVSLNPMDTMGYYLRSRCYSELGQLEEALKDAQQALKLSPTVKDYQDQLQKIQEKMKESASKTTQPSLNTTPKKEVNSEPKVPTAPTAHPPPRIQTDTDKLPEIMLSKTTRFVICYAEEKSSRMLMQGLHSFGQRYPDVHKQIVLDNIECRSLNFQFKLKVEEFLKGDVVLVAVVTKDVLQSDAFTFVLNEAVKQAINAIIIHDLESDPKFPVLSPQQQSLQKLWHQIAVPLVEEYNLQCWEKIVTKAHKFATNKSENVRTDIFLSHKQKTGQGIATSLYLSLRGQFSVFLDVKAKFELHELAAIVENTQLFVFILSQDIFDSEYCLLELQTAVKHKKKIVVVRDFFFKLPESEKDLPSAWQEFARILYSPHTVLYVANFVDECAGKIGQHLRV